MQIWMTPLARPPMPVQAWSHVVWPASSTRHFCPDLWQLHVYHHGGRLEADVPVGHVTATLAPGTVSVLPPGARSQYHGTGRGRFSCLHLRIGGGVHDTALSAVLAGDAVTASLVAAAAAEAPANPPAAMALTWAALWRMAAVARPDTDVVTRACALIEARLDDPPAVGEIAQRLGLSESHLRRLFRVARGMGVKPWIQRRRAERARHLLAHSDQSIGEIATSLGIGSVQHFNKFMHRAFGAGPRSLRERGRQDDGARSVTADGADGAKRASQDL